MQATLLINNGKIQVGPKAKVCDISNYDQIKCLGSFYSIVRPMMMNNPSLEKENNPYEPVFSKVTGARRKSPATSSVSAGYFWKSKLKKKIKKTKSSDSYGLKLRITYFVLAH